MLTKHQSNGTNELYAVIWPQERYYFRLQKCATVGSNTNLTSWHCLAIIFHHAQAHTTEVSSLSLRDLRVHPVNHSKSYLKQMTYLYLSVLLMYRRGESFDWTQSKSAGQMLLLAENNNRKWSAKSWILTNVYANDVLTATYYE